MLQGSQKPACAGHGVAAINLAKEGQPKGIDLLEMGSAPECRPPQGRIWGQVRCEIRFPPFSCCGGLGPTRARTELTQRRMTRHGLGLRVAVCHMRCRSAHQPPPAALPPHALTHAQLCMPSSAQLCMPSSAQLCMPSSAQLCMPSSTQFCKPTPGQHPSPCLTHWAPPCTPSARPMDTGC
eukprot:357308-Chlamydomonas_euryale.AAC.18